MSQHKICTKNVCAEIMIINRLSGICMAKIHIRSKCLTIMNSSYTEQIVLQNKICPNPSKLTVQYESKAFIYYLYRYCLLFKGYIHKSTNHVQNGNAACQKNKTKKKHQKKNTHTHTNKPVIQMPNLTSSELQPSVNQRSVALLRHPH